MELGEYTSSLGFRSRERGSGYWAIFAWFTEPTHCGICILGLPLLALEATNRRTTARGIILPTSAVRPLTPHSMPGTLLALVYIQGTEGEGGRLPSDTATVSDEDITEDATVKTHFVSLIPYLFVKRRLLFIICLFASVFMCVVWHLIGARLRCPQKNGLLWHSSTWSCVWAWDSLLILELSGLQWFWGLYSSEGLGYRCTWPHPAVYMGSGDSNSGSLRFPQASCLPRKHT